MPSILDMLEAVFKLRIPEKAWVLSEGASHDRWFPDPQPRTTQPLSEATLLAPTFHHHHFLHSPAREIFKLHIRSLFHPPDHKPWWLLLLLEMCSDSFARCMGVLQPRFPPCTTSPLHSNHVKIFRVSVSWESILHACVVNVVCFLSFWFLLVMQHHLKCHHPWTLPYHYFSMASLHVYCLIAGVCPHVTISLLDLKEPYFVILSIGVSETVDAQSTFFKRTRKKKREGWWEGGRDKSCLPASLLFQSHCLACSWRTRLPLKLNT